MSSPHDGPAPGRTPAAARAGGSLTRRGLLRRGLTLGAAAAAGPTLLSACGTSANAGGSAALRFWNYQAPAPQQDAFAQAQSDWYLDIIDAWNAEHAPKIKSVYIPNPVYVNGAKLPTAFAAEAGPDIFVVSPGDFLRYSNGGVLQDLTPHLSQEAIDDFTPGTLDTRTVDGRIYALPFEVEPLAMFYSVAAWEAAGLSEADIPETWDQLLDVGDKLVSAGQAGTVFETRPGYYQNFTWYPFLWSAGGEVTTPGGNSAFDSEAAVKALSLWQTAVRTGISPRTMPAAADAIAGFSQGLCSMWHRGIWTVKELDDAVPDFEYGVFRTPHPEGGRYTTGLGGWAFAANAQGKDPEAAAEFCAFALGSMREQSVQWVLDWSTKVKTDIPPRKSALARADEQNMWDTPQMRAFRHDIYPGGRAEPRYPPVIYKAVSDAIQSTMLAGADPREQVEIAEQAIDAYARTYEGGRML
ncbi:sugar ABC transporter substrate-binding protein [Streptomonospora sediminis]